MAEYTPLPPTHSNQNAKWTQINSTVVFKHFDIICIQRHIMKYSQVFNSVVWHSVYISYIWCPFDDSEFSENDIEKTPSRIPWNQQLKPRSSMDSLVEKIEDIFLGRWKWGISRICVTVTLIFPMSHYFAT